MEPQPAPPSKQTTPLQVHLVGSVPLSSTAEVFQQLTNVLPNQLRRLPDGETGERYYFVMWQRKVFEKSPWILNYRGQPAVEEPQPNAPIELNPVEWDTAALNSYAEFCRLRREGVIPQGVRFQVCLPTPVNVINLFVDPKYQEKVEVLYEKALMAALRDIQDNIPAKDLAIQWDCATEFAYIEDIDHPMFTKAWFSPLKDGFEARFTRYTAAVNESVEMGFHLCYGDAGHKHFVEPEDAGNLVEMANMISRLAPREVNWIHMPVPKDRTDDAYYAPFKELKLRSETKIFLGLAHAWDLDGTRKRIEKAREVLDDFGIASECGYGRTPKEEFEAVLEVLATASRESLN